MLNKARLRRVLRTRLSLNLFLSSATVLIFALLSGLLISLYAAGLLRNETDHINRLLLKEVAIGLDERISSASVCLRNVVYDAEVQAAARQDYTSGSLDAVQIYTVNKRMHALFQEQFSDLFVYFSNSNRIISGIHASSERMIYARAYYTDELLSAQWIDQMADASMITFVSSTFDHSAITVSQTLVLGLPISRRNAVGIGMLHSDAVKSIRSTFASDDSLFLAVNRAGETFFATAEWLYDFPIDLSVFSDDSAVLTLNGKEYAAHCYTSPQTHATYILAQQASTSWKQLQSFRYFSFSVSAIFLFIGLIIVYLSVRHNYQPIGRLVSDVAKRMDYPAIDHEKNEIAYLHQVIFTTLNANRKHAKILRDGFIHRALTGSHNTQNDLFSEFREYGIELLSDQFTVFTLLLEENGSLIDVSQCLTAIGKTFDEVLDEIVKDHLGILLCHRADAYSYVLNLPVQASLDNAHVAVTCRDRLNEKYGALFTIACGERLSGWDGIARSYSIATELLSQRAIYGAGSYIPLSGGSPPTFHYRLSHQKEIETAILSCIQTGTPAPDAVLAAIRENCLDSPIRLPLEFQCYAHDLCAILGGIIEHLEISDDVLEPLRLSDNLPDFERDFVKLLSDLGKKCSTVRSEREDLREKALVEEVMTYIEKNIASPNLCADEIGKQFGLSGQYLSKRYKKMTGISLSNQIMICRMDMAKRLLVESDDSIEHIADKLGFLDSSAFIRVFKKNVNITPGMYRKLYRKA